MPIDDSMYIYVGIYMYIYRCMCTHRPIYIRRQIHVWIGVSVDG